MYRNRHVNLILSKEILNNTQMDCFLCDVIWVHITHKIFRENKRFIVLNELYNVCSFEQSEKHESITGQSLIILFVWPPLTERRRIPSLRPQLDAFLSAREFLFQLLVTVKTHTKTFNLSCPVAVNRSHCSMRHNNHWHISLINNDTL